MRGGASKAWRGEGRFWVLGDGKEMGIPMFGKEERKGGEDPLEHYNLSEKMGKEEFPVIQVYTSHHYDGDNTYPHNPCDCHYHLNLFFILKSFLLLLLSLLPYRANVNNSFDFAYDEPSQLNNNGNSTIVITTIVYCYH